MNSLPSVPILKFLLIIGVVLIHCNISTSISPDAYVVDFTTSLMQICVPSFFILSGFLFFNGIKSLTWHIYTEKLSRRVRTLFIPYMIWNMLCAVLFIIKVNFLGFPGLGIIEDGTIHWGAFFEGFFFRSQDDGYPYAFAFWFIRNLMVFIVLAGIIYLLAKRWWMVFIIFIATLFKSIDTGGLEWFICGAALALHRISLKDIAGKSHFMVACGILFLAIGVIRYRLDLSFSADKALLAVEILSAFTFLSNIANRLVRYDSMPVIRLLCQSTFFIYAFHQCYSTITRRFWMNLLGYETVMQTVSVYLSSFFSLVLTSIAMYCFLKKFFPKLLGLITGNRT